jgi:hypothetical protein
VPPELQEQKIQEQQVMLGQVGLVVHMGEEIQMLAAVSVTPAGVLVGVVDLEVMVVMVAIPVTIKVHFITIPLQD